MGDVGGSPVFGEAPTATTAPRGLDGYAVGRGAAKSRATMPPKGGNAALTDSDLRGIVAHIRALGGAALPPAPVAEAPKATPDPDAFKATCAPCHGNDGRGKPNLGSDLAGPFVNGVLIVEDHNNGWTYDAETWFLHFNGEAVPNRGAVTRASYTVLPGSLDRPASEL